MAKTQPKAGRHVPHPSHHLGTVSLPDRAGILEPINTKLLRKPKTSKRASTGGLKNDVLSEQPANAQHSETK